MTEAHAVHETSAYVMFLITFDDGKPRAQWLVYMNRRTGQPDAVKELKQ